MPEERDAGHYTIVDELLDSDYKFGEAAFRAETIDHFPRGDGDEAERVAAEADDD